LSAGVALFLLAMFLGYVYAFVGGFTDAANAIATSVGTRVLSPRAAVIMAGVCNLLGGMTGTAVAVTIGRGIVDPDVLTLLTVVAALGGAMSWSLITYRFGIPVSETHGLVGGLVGAGVATAGLDVVQWQGVTKVLLAIFTSPSLGFIGGMLLITLIYWLCRGMGRRQANRLFGHLQRLSAAYMAFSHGRNDAQKPMGVLALAMTLHFGWEELVVPLWVAASAARVAAIGTAYGGWRIIRTIGIKMVDLKPVEGFAAEVSGASVIQVASELGIPISTTHAITSSIVGVGVTRRTTAVSWGLAGNIMLSWMLTVPATMVLGWLYLVGLRSLLS